MKLSLVFIATFIIAAAFARTGVITGGSCATAGTTCQSVDCCGTATPKSGTTKKTVCNTSTATTWTDVANGNAEYYFACNAVDNAMALVGGLTIAASSLATMVIF